MTRSPLLFTREELPRSKRQVRMHVVDASGCWDIQEPGEQHVRFKCAKCGAETDWETMPSITAARRGIPCHNCNSDEEI